MTDGVMCSIMKGNDTPSVLTDWLRSRCVPIGVKRLKVLITCREFWVSGKPSNQSARGVDIPPTTHILVLLVTWFNVWEYVLQGQPGVRSCSHATDVRPAHWMCIWSCSRLCWTWSTSQNERQMVASEWPFGVPSVWVRFILARLEIRFRIVRFSRRLRLLDPFITQSNKSNYVMSNDDVCYNKFCHAWIAIVAYLEWIIN
jgi:hypothetical protein